MARRPRQLRIKPYDPDKPWNPGTEAQQKARRRTWRIIQLRALWVQSAHVKTRWRLWLIRSLLDDELASLGAERHGVRFQRQRAELEADLKSRRRDNAIPF
jgi:hypothetical protein